MSMPSRLSVVAVRRALRGSRALGQADHVHHCFGALATFGRGADAMHDQRQRDDLAQGLARVE